MKQITNSGPLCGLKIIEFEGIGPAPLAGQLLSDLGADVIKIKKKPNNLKIEPILDRFLMNCIGLERNCYYIQRVMYMDIPPNEPEQQIHQDGDEKDGTYYIFMPLNYWSHDMGATVYYKDSIVEIEGYELQ